MRTCDVDSHILGNSYEYLIAKFADDAGKKGGEFYTPKEVVRLLVEIHSQKKAIHCMILLVDLEGCFWKLSIFETQQQRWSKGIFVWSRKEHQYLCDLQDGTFFTGYRQGIY